MSKKPSIPRREQILEVALQRFSKYGYSETSTRQICADLGLAHSAVYNHFRSKEELLLSIEEREFLIMQTSLESLMEFEKSASPQRRAFLAVRLTFQRTIASREAWRLSLEAIRSFKPKNRAAAILRRDRYQNLLRDLIIEALRAEGKDPAGANLGVLHLFGICDGISRWYSPSGPLTEDAIVNDTAHWAMRGLDISNYEVG